MRRQSAEHLLQSQPLKNPFCPRLICPSQEQGLLPPWPLFLPEALCEVENTGMFSKCQVSAFFCLFLKKTKPKPSKLMRSENSSVSLDYKINPAISRFSEGFLLVLTWANWALPAGATNPGAICPFPWSCLHPFALLNPNPTRMPESLQLPLLGCAAAEKPREARCPLAVFTWLQLDNFQCWVGSGQPAAG